MKVYLINPPSDFLLDDKSNVPLGLLYIDSYLHSKGIDVKIVDLAGQKEEEWEIPMDGDVYGVTATTPQFETACRIAELVEGEGRLLVLGGVHCTVAPQESLRDSKFKIAVRHEGEDTMLEICQPGIHFKDIDGISWKDDEGLIRHNDNRPFERNIDKFPHPRLDAIDMDSYHCGVFTTPDGDVIRGTQIITSRGCPYNCSFCCSPFVYSRKVRYHSVEYMKEWLDQLNEAGYNNFYIVDDIFMLKKARLKLLLEDFIERGSIWRACVRADVCTKEKLQSFYDAGCRQVDIGVESGSQKVLDIVHKGEKVEDNAQAIQWCHEVGIKVKSCIIVGLPGEEREDVELTRDFIRTNRPDSVTLCTFIPYPGTDIYKHAQLYGYTIDPSAPYSQYVLCGADSLVASVATEERNARIMEHRQLILDTVAEVSQTTNQVLKNRKEK